MAVNSTLLLPSPLDTVKGLCMLLGDSGFYLDAAATIGRCIAAVLMALAAGVILAIASYMWELVRDILSLPIALFKTIPIMAVAIYMILLMTAGSVPILVCWIMCFPIVYTNLLSGLDAMDKGLLEMAKLYGINGWRRIRFLYIPSLYPQFRSAMSLVAGMSWKAIVTAEVLSIPRFSLGYELMNSKYYLNTDLLFAYVIVIILVSLVFEKLTKKGVALLAPKAYEGSRVPQTANGFAEAAVFEGAQEAVAAEASAANASRVDLESVSKAYGDKIVLDNFDMQLEPGTVTALMGPSGSGKTTIARLIAGLEKADSGSVKFDGKVAYLFQEDRLLPWLNVYDNLALVCDDAERIHAVLQAVGLEDEKWLMPEELSGGMSHRVAMARAFLQNAGLLIADEPFRGLDEASRNSVIAKLWKPGITGKTVLLITHSENDMTELADRIVNI